VWVIFGPKKYVQVGGRERADVVGRGADGVVEVVVGVVLVEVRDFVFGGRYAVSAAVGAHRGGHVIVLGHTGVGGDSGEGEDLNTYATVNAYA
jgi:hypothetical protein